MILTDYFRSERSIQWDYAKQVGVKHATIRLPEDKRFDETDASHWRDVISKFTSEGIVPLVLEPLPNSLHEHIKKGDEFRDPCIDRVIKMIKIMDKFNVRTICFNFMAHIGWFRTSHGIPERGGATVSGFNINDFAPSDNYAITHDKLWDNLKYFLDAVIPHADRYNIKFALHPDDPPVPNLGSVARILTSFENIKRAISLSNSPNLGVTLCQGSYVAMGENLELVIRHFAIKNKLFFVHFRDVVGDRYNFRETFHDNGTTNMAQIANLYRSLGINVPIRVDHVPAMASEASADIGTVGYGNMGRLFAIGYLKGLFNI